MKFDDIMQKCVSILETNSNLFSEDEKRNCFGVLFDAFSDVHYLDFSEEQTQLVIKAYIKAFYFGLHPEKMCGVKEEGKDDEQGD